MAKTITITVDKVGGATIKTQGFAGQDCKRATRAIEEGLGIVESDQATSEAYGAGVGQTAENRVNQ